MACMGRSCGNCRYHRPNPSGRSIMCCECQRLCVEAIEPRMMLAASMVADLNIAAVDNSIRALGHLGNVALFEHEIGKHSSLYRSDGTKAGTVPLADFKQYTILDPIQTIGTSFFFTEENDSTPSLWKTDGTVAGTIKLAAVQALGAHAVIGNTLFFAELTNFDDYPQRAALWKTDGTAAGTVRLSGDIGISQTEMTAFDGAVY